MKEPLLKVIKRKIKQLLLEAAIGLAIVTALISNHYDGKHDE